MLKNIIPLLIVSLTIGLLAGCSSSNPLIEKTETSISEQNYEAAIAASEKFIQQQPQNPVGYYYKGVALAQKAEAQKNPSQATDYYKQMQQAFSKAKELASQMEEAPEELDRIDAVKTSMWRIAHNKGVKFATNDSLMGTTQNPLKTSIAYLNNATIIQPDSAISYQALAQINGMQKNFEQAAQAQKKFITMADSVSARNYLVLAQYYRNADKPEEALQVLLKTQDKYPGNIKVVEILADTYSQMGNYEKAITIVERLVEEDPENPQYHLALGSRILRSSLKLQESYEKTTDEIFQLQRQLSGATESEAAEIKQQIQALKQENEALLQQINALHERAIAEFKAVIQYRPDEANAYNNLGIIYQNKAALLYGKRNLTQNREEASSYDQQADKQLQTAMKYYEQAVELDPDNTSYWRSLYQIYTALGMDKKANEAAKKAGIQ